MSTDEFQQIWREYDRKLERSIQMNVRIFTEVQQQKARSVLRPMLVGRVVGIIIGSLYLILLGMALYYVRSQPVMAVSIAVFFICTVVAIAAYIRDIVVIRGLDFSDSVVDAQKKLAGLRSSAVRILAICWIQLPFWATFFVSNKLLWTDGFLQVEIPIVLVFIAAAVFLYKNITVENAQQKKWVANMIKSSGARSLGRAIELLKEVEEFRREE